MKKRKLKKWVVPTIYSVSLLLLVACVYFIEETVSNQLFSEDYEYVDESTNVIDETPIYDDIPVVNTDIEIIKPFNNEGVKIINNYYDYQGSNEDQEDSILYYEDTYMQNSGIDYALEDNSNSFEVISILDGTVSKVEEDDILGTIVEIKYSNDLIGVYQSLSEVSVKENDNVMQGQVIAKSGLSNIGVDMGSHLHFELYYQGKVVNPNNFYGKYLGEL